MFVIDFIVDRVIESLVLFVIDFIVDRVIESLVFVCY